MIPLSTEQKHAFIRFLTAVEQYRGTGASKFNWIIRPIPYLFLGGAFLVPEWVSDNFVVLAIGYVASEVFLVSFGWWWDKKRYYHVASAWGNENHRNQGMEELRVRLDRIEKLLLDQCDGADRGRIKE